MLRALPFALALALAACADEDGHDHDHDHDTPGDDGSTPDTYEDGLSKLSQAGHYEALLTLDPAPHVGLHDLTLEILAAPGHDHHGMDRITGATLTLDATMPDHGHGTTPVTVTETGDAVYTASGLDLMMAGTWELAFDIDAATPDAVVYRFVVE